MADSTASMCKADRAARATALEREILAAIPIARAMQLSLCGYDGDSLTLAAPLAPNINDKGCAFGGSLASLMTLAGWGLVRLLLGSRGIDADIYVKDSTIRYLAPVWQDFSATARIADSHTFETFLNVLKARGKGRLRLRCAVPLAGSDEAAVLDAEFVAVAKR